MRRWARFVGYTQVVLAALGALIMAFFALASLKGRVVTVPAAVACALLTAWRLKQLQGERAKVPRSSSAETGAQDPASTTPPNTSMERTRGP